MINRKNFRTVDVDLNQELVDTLGKKIESGRFSANLRLSLERLIDSFDRSPEEFSQKLLDNLSRVKVVKWRHQVIKRMTVGVDVDDLSELDRLVRQLQNRIVGLNRQDLMRFSLLLWLDLV